MLYCNLYVLKLIKSTYICETNLIIMKKLFTVLAVVSTALVANAQIVINEVYGGGGTSTSPIKYDFVELVNRGNSSITLTGAFLQYASTNGAFGAGTNPDNNKLALPSITLNPGQHYLIQLSGGTVGADLAVTPDFIPSGGGVPNNPLSLSSTGGKIALTSSIQTVTTPTDNNVLDFVGWGSANLFEGSAAAPATTVSTSITRNANYADTNNNAADFSTATPTPKNTSSSLSTLDIKLNSNHLVKASVISNDIIFNENTNVSIYNALGQLIMEKEVKKDISYDVSSLPAGVYYVKGTVKGEKVSQKIIKK